MLHGDFNGHIGKEVVNYNSVHGGFAYGVRNESGEIFLEFALAKELVIKNSIFRKKDEHLITYKSGGHATQIDYCLIWKDDRSSCLDCKVVLGIEIPTQHRLLVLVFRMRRKIAEKKIKVRETSKWNRLKGDMVATLPSKIKTSGYLTIPDDANHMWVTMAETIQKVAKETLGVSLGKPKVFKKSWWWNEEVKKKIKDKNREFKELMTCMEEEDRIHKNKSYKEAKRAAKKAIA